MVKIKPTTTPATSGAGSASPTTGPEAPKKPKVAAAGVSVDGVDAPKKGAKAAAVTAATTVPGIPEEFPITALSKLEAKGAQGQTFMLDAGALRGLKLQIRRVKDGAEPGFELMLQLTAGRLTGLLERMDKAGAATGGVTFRGVDVGEDGIATYNSNNSTISSSSTHAPPDLNSNANTWARSLDGTKGGKVEVVNDKAALALRGLLRIQLRGDDAQCTEQLQAIVNKLGLGDLFAPPTPKSKRINMLMRVLWQVDHEKAESLAAGDLGKLKPEDLEQALKDKGFDQARIDGLRYEEVFSGHFTVVDPKQAEEMVKAGARYLYSTVTMPEHVHSILQGGQKASLQRFAEGLIVTGMSTNADFITGGARGVFTRVVTQNAILDSHSWSGRTYKLLQTHEQLGRTDFYGWNGDKFGRRWQLTSAENFGPSLVDKVHSGGTSFASSNELIFTAGNRPENIQRVIATNESDRTKLIDYLKKEGYTPHNGLSLEDFVVLSPKFLVFGPSPFGADADLPKLAAEALEAAKGGKTMQLVGFLLEAPSGPEKAGLEKEALETPNLRTHALKAIRTRGRFELSTADLEALVKAELAANKGQDLVSQAGGALLASNLDAAAELVQKYPQSSSYYSNPPPYGLQLDEWPKLFEALSDASGDAGPSKALSLALDLKAQELLQNGNASLKGLLEKKALVKPKDPDGFVAEQLAGLSSGSIQKPATLALYLAGPLEPKAREAALLKVIQTDHAQSAQVLRSVLALRREIPGDGAAVIDAVLALPEGSQVRNTLLGEFQDVLLSFANDKIKEPLAKKYTGGWQTDYAVGARWPQVIQAQLERTGGKLTPFVQHCLELGAPNLVSDKDFPKTLAQFPELYAVDDVAAFVTQAKTEMQAPKPGLLKMHWLLHGAKLDDGQRVELVTGIATGDYALRNILTAQKNNHPKGHLPLDAPQLEAVVDKLTALESADNGGLQWLLQNAGRQLLETGSAGVLPKIDAYLTAKNTTASNALNLSGDVPALVLEALDARGDADAATIKSWVLEKTSLELIKSGTTKMLDYLKASKAGWKEVGLDGPKAAKLLQEHLNSYSYYYTNSSYASGSYAQLPVGFQWIVTDGGAKVSKGMVEAIAADVKSWNLSDSLFDAMCDRLPGLSDAQREKLSKARKGE